jgi:hypothetical protein
MIDDTYLLSHLRLQPWIVTTTGKMRAPRAAADEDDQTDAAPDAPVDADVRPPPFPALEDDAQPEDNAEADEVSGIDRSISLFIGIPIYSGWPKMV